MSGPLSGLYFIDAIAVVANGLRAAMFPKMGKIHLKWHTDESEAIGCWYPNATNLISLRPDARELSRSQLCALLCHEFAHAATRGETADGGHGPRWRSVMRNRCGIDPDRGIVLNGGPLDTWLRTYGW